MPIIIFHKDDSVYLFSANLISPYKKQSKSPWYFIRYYPLESYDLFKPSE